MECCSHCGNGASLSPVFRRGDPTLPNNCCPISLASCFFKVLDHLVHSRIAPPYHSPIGVPRRIGVPMSLSSSLVSMLSAPSSSHTFLAFIDIQIAFDTSWVEGTLARLFDAGVRGRMTSCAISCVARSGQVRCGSSPSLQTLVGLWHCSRASPLNRLLEHVRTRNRTAHQGATCRTVRRLQKQWREDSPLQCQSPPKVQRVTNHNELVTACHARNCT